MNVNLPILPLTLSRFRFLWILLLLLSFDSYAQTGDAKDEVGNESPKALIRTHLIPESIEQLALADESMKKQIVWLDSAEGTNGKIVQFLGLELAGQTSTPQGAVLFLHGVEQHPNWPDVIKPLRTILPEHGWYTLSVMLPYKSYLPSPTRDFGVKEIDSVGVDEVTSRFSGRRSAPVVSGDDTENPDNKSNDNELVDGDVADGDLTNENTTENASPETEADLVSAGDDIDVSSKQKSATDMTKEMTFDEKMAARMTSSLSYLNEQGHQNIILVGYKQGAQGIFDYLETNKGQLPEKGITIIWIDAVFREYPEKTMEDAMGKDVSLLILDIVDSSSGGLKTSEKQRAGEAKKLSYTGYSQIKLPVSTAGRSKVSAFTQRVRSWLQVHAPGMEVTEINK